MKGKVLDFNMQDSSGVISGDDGSRYNFAASEWKSTDIHPANGIEVDFDTNEGNATAIYAQAPVQIAGEKNKIVAALLAFFLGGLGIHKFYLGCNKAGIIMLLVSIIGVFLLAIPTLVIGIIAFIEFIIYLTKSDADFDAIYVQNKKCWF